MSKRQISIPGLAIKPDPRMRGFLSGMQLGLGKMREIDPVVVYVVRAGWRGRVGRREEETERRRDGRPLHVGDMDVIEPMGDAAA